MWGAMVIEQLRQNARREAAEKQAQDRASGSTKKNAPPAKGRARRAKSRARAAPGITRHRLFVPILVIWGAALAGLSVMVLSGVTIARLSMFAGLGALGDLARVVFAVLAAVPGAGLGLGLAMTVRKLGAREQRGAAIAEMAMRRVRPIDPASDLGSASLDAPIERMPFGGGQGDFGSDDDDAGIEAPFERAVNAQVGDAGIDEIPTSADDGAFALDLGAFDAIEPEFDTPSKSDMDVGGLTDDPGIPTPRASTGVEKLRQTPPQDLSLVQLVERFAAALHDLQGTDPREIIPWRRPAQATGREAELAEALRALALFSERGFDVPAPEGTNADAPGSDTTERELHEALARLQTLRGAA